MPFVYIIIGSFKELHHLMPIFQIGSVRLSCQSSRSQAAMAAICGHCWGSSWGARQAVNFPEPSLGHFRVWEFALLKSLSDEFFFLKSYQFNNNKSPRNGKLRGREEAPGPGAPEALVRSPGLASATHPPPPPTAVAMRLGDNGRPLGATFHLGQRPLLLLGYIWASACSGSFQQARDKGLSGFVTITQQL